MSKITSKSKANSAPSTGLARQVPPKNSQAPQIQTASEQRSAGEQADQLQRGIDLSSKGQQVLRDFTQKVETATEMTARDLFDPSVQRIEDHPLSKKISDEQMKRMVSDLAKNMPVSDLPGGEDLAQAARLLPGADAIPGDISQMSYNELRRALPKAAREKLEEQFKPLLKDFRKNHTAAFYSLTALGAVGVGALGYSQGSAALKKLGLKPRIRKSFFDHRVNTSVEATWDKKFKDPAGKVGVEGRSRDNRLSLLTEASFDGNGVQKVQVRGRARIDDQPLGLDQLSLHGAYTHDFVNNQDLSSLGISGSKGALSFSATDTRNWSTGDARTELDLGAHVWGGRLSGYAAHIKENKHREQQAGVIFRVRF